MYVYIARCVYTHKMCVCTYEEVYVTQEDVGGCCGRNMYTGRQTWRKSKAVTNSRIAPFLTTPGLSDTGGCDRWNEHQRCQVTLNNENPMQGTFLLQ